VGRIVAGLGTGMNTATGMNAALVLVCRFLTNKQPVSGKQRPAR
jgi:hypothetical protein